MIDEITVNLKDLKVLGKQGGATARLEDGTDLILKPDYAVKQAKLSQQTLADQIGVFRNTISNWETGYSQISLENAKKVAEYFGVTIEYLLGSESE